MAVLAEAISVIVRRDAIESAYAGGWSAFVSNVPNATMCSDGKLARVGFMEPDTVKEFVEGLELHGLKFQSDGKCVDIAVVDQNRGPTLPCDWLEFARLPMGKGKVAACWLFEGARIAAGIHMQGTKMDLATPDGWTFEGSLSEKFTFVAEEDLEGRLKYLGNRDGLEVFMDQATGREVYKPSSCK